jgi:hypothetical protein
LGRIGDIEVAEGNLDMARTLYSECLEISRKLAEQLDTPDSLRDVSVFLEKIGDIEKAIKIKNAKQKYLRFRKGHHE